MDEKLIREKEQLERQVEIVTLIVECGELGPGAVLDRLTREILSWKVRRMAEKYPKLEEIPNVRP